MECVNDASKYIAQAKKLLENLGDYETLIQIRELLDKAEEALVKGHKYGETI
jgi:hypothetical protein